jgi:phenylalanyl-tRNA synthetase beta chain
MPTPEQVADIFTMRAFEIESVEKKGDDTVYDIKILPDRSPYAYGIRYVALELALLVPELVLKKEYYDHIHTTIDTTFLSQEVDMSLVDTSGKELCPLYTLTRIDNIQNKTSSKDITDALSVLGQQSRGLVVDLTNLMMFDTGQPLHAFDADKVDGNIRVSTTDADVEVMILGGKKVSLTKGTLVIRDDKDILAIAGVKGCVKAEVTADTKHIYLEAASFDRTIVRKTSRSLDLINDSSKRFEQGVTIERPIVALQSFLQAIHTYIPACVVHNTHVSTDLSTLYTQEKLTKITVDVSRCVRLVDDSDSTLTEKFIDFIENTLPKTGAQVEKVSTESYVVTSPIYRADLQIEADVVDEFIRYVGYETIQYVPTEKVEKVSQERRYQVLQAIRKFLVSKGYTEVLLHTLVDSKKNESAIRLENSLTSERDALRVELAPELVTATMKNYPYLDLVEKKAVELFEIGVVHSVEKVDGIDVSGIQQRTHLALAVGMPKWPKKVDESRTLPVIFQELCMYLGVDISNVKNTESKDATAKVLEVDITDVIEVAKIPHIENVIKTEGTKFTYKKASIYPSMSRDIAFFVEGEESQENVDTYIRETAKKYALIETVTCFDIFSKDGKTSYGYRFVFQSYEKTLTEEEVSSIMSSIASVVQGKGWIVR